MEVEEDDVIAPEEALYWIAPFAYLGNKVLLRFEHLLIILISNYLPASKKASYHSDAIFHVISIQYSF